MKRYIHIEKKEEINLFDLNKIYEKIQITARIIFSILILEQ